MATEVAHINTESGDKPCIEGTRITIQHIAEYYTKFDWAPERIAESFRLTLAQVHAGLAYYYDHQEAIDTDIQQDAAAMADAPGVEEILAGELALVMTPREIAEEFPITEQAVYKAIERGRLRARKSGGSWLIHRRDAEDLWADNED